MRDGRHASRAGFSLIEIIIAVALCGAVFLKITTLFREYNDVMRKEVTSLSMEDHARRVVDQIALAILQCDREALAPILAPGHSTALRYQVSLGVEDGEVSWGDIEEIAMGQAEDEGCVLWRSRPGMADSQEVVWSRQVQELLEGEEVNGFDDNGNGLVDEEGLNFVVDGNRVTVRISLGITTEGGEENARSVETWVTCRNNPL